MKMPYKMNVAGHSHEMFIDSLHTHCGTIKDGLAFRFGDEGGWVLSLKELKRVVEAAEVEQRKDL